MKPMALLALLAALFAGCGPVSMRAPALDDIYWDEAAWVDKDEIVVETVNRKGIYNVKWMVESKGPYWLFVNDAPVAEGTLECGKVTYDLTWGVRAERGQKNCFAVYRDSSKEPIRAVIDVVYSDGSEDIFGSTP